MTLIRYPRLFHWILCYYSTMHFSSSLLHIDVNGLSFRSSLIENRRLLLISSASMRFQIQEDNLAHSSIDSDARLVAIVVKMTTQIDDTTSPLWKAIAH